MGVFENWEYLLFFGPYSKDPTIWGTMRVPYFRSVALVPLANVSIVHRKSYLRNAACIDCSAPLMFNTGALSSLPTLMALTSCHEPLSHSAHPHAFSTISSQQRGILY